MPYNSCKISDRNLVLDQPIDIFLYSYQNYMFASYCIDIVRKNPVLNLWLMGVKQLINSSLQWPSEMFDHKILTAHLVNWFFVFLFFLFLSIFFHFFSVFLFFSFFSSLFFFVFCFFLPFFSFFTFFFFCFVFFLVLLFCFWWLICHSFCLLILKISANIFFVNTQLRKAVIWWTLSD